MFTALVVCISFRALPGKEAQLEYRLSVYLGSLIAILLVNGFYMGM